MKLKRHIKNHSLIDTFKQFEIKSKTMFLINNLTTCRKYLSLSKDDDEDEESVLIGAIRMVTMAHTLT